MDYILEVNNLYKGFPGVKAVDGVSFSIPYGICFGLLGPNGAGKTTTIEVIEGIQKPDEGIILYKGKNRDHRFKQEVGIQLQTTELQQYLTVKEILLSFRNLYAKRADLNDLIAMCYLDEILNRDNRKISGGQKQRLLLAIALANDPELLFLDEPTTGLDPQARRHVWDIVQTIKMKGKTIILTTHYMEEAQNLCDVVAIMDQGKIIAMDSPINLLNQYCRGVTITLPSVIDVDMLNSIECNWYMVNNTIEIQTEKPHDCLRVLIDKNIDITGMVVRSQNLEDLFLKLTGTQLRA
jgi:ABC-2 type transport system ATP-binding protein